MDKTQAGQQVEWVFAYGSLIWNPEIDFDHAELVRVHGFHRSFCIRSVRHRGTPDHPGVVLGLDRGGSCVGMVYRLRPATRAQSIEILYEREMQFGVYVPTLLSARLGDGSAIRALTFIANRASNAYQRLADSEIVQRMQRCIGQRGPNAEYLLNTWESLQARGVRDEMLTRLARCLGALGPGAGGSHKAGPGADASLNASAGQWQSQAA